MSEKIVQKMVCSFCAKSEDEENGRFFIYGNPQDGGFIPFICNECIISGKKLIDDEIKKLQPEALLEAGITPSKIKEHLDHYIIGQEHAKTVMAVAVYNHYKFLEYKDQENPPVEIEKSNILIVGPTGCGKTALLKHLAKILGVPFAIADATNLTSAGFVGEDVENVVRLLLENAKGNIEKAERGIIYIDEIDKLSRKGENVSITKDVGGEGVQQALLKIIEGSDVDIPPKGGRKHPTQEVIRVNTENILFVVGGSFEGIEKIIARREQTNLSKMGFSAIVESKKAKGINDFILNVKAEDLKKFGMLPELLGRLPIICPMKELDEEALRMILTEPKGALIKQYQELIAMDGVRIEFTDDAITEIVKKAIQRKTGARSLRSIMEETLLPHMFHLPDDQSIEKMTITKECVEGIAGPLFERLPAA